MTMLKSVFRAFGLGGRVGVGASNLDLTEGELQANANFKVIASKPARPSAPRLLRSTFDVTSIASDKLMEPDQVQRQFDIVKVVGESKTATVSLARHIKTGERVAIKRHARKDRGDMHVYREAAIHAVMDHPNIASLRAFAEGSDYLYILQEYCAGGELFDAVMPDVGCTAHVARSYILQLCKAMAYTHSRNIAHRDLKPENIMLSGDKKTVKLIDFGLSEACIENQRYKQHIGTIPYMAVELWAPAKDGYAIMDLKAIDVWAAGVVLYTMVCGRFPFAEATSRSPEFRRYKDGDFSQGPWGSIAREHPAAMPLLLNMMHLEPSQRWTFEQCIKYIETSWIVEAPKKQRNLHNLRIGVGRKAIGDDTAPMPTPLSPLALSPHRKISRSGLFDFAYAA